MYQLPNFMVMYSHSLRQSSTAVVELLEWATSKDLVSQPLSVLIELRHYHRNAGGKDFLNYLEESYNGRAVVETKRGNSELLFSRKPHPAEPGSVFPRLSPKRLSLPSWTETQGFRNAFLSI
jgi:hypothetical protein